MPLLKSNICSYFGLSASDLLLYLIFDLEALSKYINIKINNKRIEASCIAVSRSYRPYQVLKMPVVKVGMAKCSTAPKSERVSIATKAIPAKIAGLIKGS